MCSMFRPRSSSRTERPLSVSSLAAQPPEIPDPTTMASYVGTLTCTLSRLEPGAEERRFAFESRRCWRRGGADARDGSYELGSCRLRHQLPGSDAGIAPVRASPDARGKLRASAVRELLQLTVGQAPSCETLSSAMS